MQLKALGIVAYVFPAHLGSIVARFCGYGRTYIWLHGAWHIGSAYAVYALLRPPQDMASLAVSSASDVGTLT